MKNKFATITNNVPVIRHGRVVKRVSNLKFAILTFVTLLGFGFAILLNQIIPQKATLNFNSKLAWDSTKKIGYE
ncbi:MAG: hypothetical protein LBN42_01225, partial [Oscillospiraceae bacterium]|nr:hypothetical protein [Oscillospiraceae bacterium]